MRRPSHKCVISMREAKDLIRWEQLFVHLRICTFVWPILPIKPPKKKQIHRRHHPMGTVPQLSFVNLCIRIWAKEITALVFCVFYSNPSTIAAVGAIQRRHSPDGGIQWLRVKPWMCSIRQCAPHCTAASPWPPKSSSICLHFLSRRFRCWPQP